MAIVPLMLLMLSLGRCVSAMVPMRRWRSMAIPLEIASVAAAAARRSGRASATACETEAAAASAVASATAGGLESATAAETVPGVSALPLATTMAHRPRTKST